MKLHLKKMFRLPLKRLVPWLRKKSEHATRPYQAADDDLIASDLFRRALAAAKTDTDGGDLVSRYSSAVKNIDMALHEKLLRVSLDLSFCLIHPVLALRLFILRRAILAMQSGKTQDQILIASRCRGLLSEIELGRDLPQTVCRAARLMAERYEWDSASLRRAIILGVIIPSKSESFPVEVNPPNRAREVMSLVISSALIGTALLFAAYAAKQFWVCHDLDCAVFGLLYLAAVALGLGLPTLQTTRERRALYTAAASSVIY